MKDLQSFGIQPVGNAFSLDVRKGSPPMFAAFHSVISKGEYGFSFCSKTPTDLVAVVIHHLLKQITYLSSIRESPHTTSPLAHTWNTLRTKFLMEIILLYLKYGQLNFK